MKGTSRHSVRVEPDWNGNLHVWLRSVARHCTGENGRVVSEVAKGET